MKTHSIISSAVLTAIGLALTGWASEAIAFTGQSSARWGIPNPGMNPIPVFAGVHTSTFLWGDPGVFGSEANGLTFIGTPFAVQAGSPFKVGTLSYFNSTTYAGTGVQSVPLSLTLVFDAPQSWSETFQLNFEIETTLNSDDTIASADALIPRLDVFEKTVNLNGIDHTLSLIGFSQGNDSRSFKDLKALEGHLMTATLFGKIAIASTSVPEPSVAIGLSLLGLYWVMGKQNRHHS